MEAKDTVMKAKEVALIKHPILKSARGVIWGEYVKPSDKLILKAQAEMSFKAGREQGIVIANVANADNLKRMRLAGIREVVEWIESNHTLVEKRLDWQAKLKEWGIYLTPPS